MKENENEKHELVNKELIVTKSDILAKCICGWESLHFSGMTAGCAFLDHKESYETNKHN